MKHVLGKSLLVILFCLGAACASKKAPPPTPITAEPVLATGVASDARVLQAAFTSDRDRIYLLLSGVPGTTGAQIFERDLKSGKERRLTWQDGMIESFDVSLGGELVYSSSTDEIKERFHPSERPSEQGLPLEIYLSDRFGNDIRRLTHHAGYDGEAVFTPLGREILFVSKRGPTDVVFRMGLESLKPKLIASSGTVRRRSPSFANDGRIAWIESAEADGPGPVRVAARKAPLTAEQRWILRLKKAPAAAGWTVSERLSDTSSRLLYVKTDPDCEREIWSGKGLLRSFDLSTHWGKMLLVIQDGDKTALQVKDLPADAFTCEPAPAAAKIEP